LGEDRGDRVAERRWQGDGIGDRHRLRRAGGGHDGLRRTALVRRRPASRWQDQIRADGPAEVGSALHAPQRARRRGQGHRFGGGSSAGTGWATDEAPFKAEVKYLTIDKNDPNGKCNQAKYKLTLSR